MASTSLSQRWLSEVEAVGTLINRNSLMQLIIQKRSQVL